MCTKPMDLHVFEDATSDSEQDKEVNLKPKDLIRFSAICFRNSCAVELKDPTSLYMIGKCFQKLKKDPKVDFYQLSQLINISQ
jgi:hypothetical protein